MATKKTVTKKSAEKRTKTTASEPAVKAPVKTAGPAIVREW